MHLFYSTDKTPDAVSVQALFKQTEWANARSIEDIQIILDGSLTAGAWVGTELVGFARAVTDGRFRAFIEDVVVDEAYRKQGIGAAIVELLLDDLRHIEEIVLQCIEDNVGFYEKFNFERTTIVTMHKRQA